MGRRKGGGIKGLDRLRAVDCEYELVALVAVVVVVVLA